MFAVKEMCLQKMMNSEIKLQHDSPFRHENGNNFHIFLSFTLKFKTKHLKTCCTLRAQLQKFISL